MDGQKGPEHHSEHPRQPSDPLSPNPGAKACPDPCTDGPAQYTEGFNEKIHWGAILKQSLGFLVFEHTFRLANDRYARHLLLHKSFWEDYGDSLQHFDMGRWGDGDDFLVNYIGHPLQGAVSGNIFIQNDPHGRSERFGKSGAYWKSRFRAMLYAAAYSAYFEAGPVLSEAALGNEGGYTYVPKCGLAPCTIPGRTLKPATNNTGWVDFVVTPTVGIGWIVLEDAIEARIVDPLAGDSTALKWKILRGSLAPSHSMANFFQGKLPWYRPWLYENATGRAGNLIVPSNKLKDPSEASSWRDQGAQSPTALDESGNGATAACPSGDVEIVVIKPSKTLNIAPENVHVRRTSDGNPSVIFAEMP